MDMSNNRLYLRNFSIYQNDRILFNDTTTLEDLSSSNRPIFIGSFNQPFINSLVPFLVTFYLFVIVTCFNTIYRYLITEQEENNQNTDSPVVRNRGMNNPVGSITPPPSYSIFISSGESILIPPPYKMVLPYLYAQNGNPSSISPSNSIASMNEANDAPPTYCITCHTIQSEPLTILAPPTIEEESDKMDQNEDDDDDAGFSST